MTYIPMCDYGPHLWPRKKHLFYLAWGQNGDYQRYRLRFCPEHLTVIEEHLAEFEAEALGVAIRTGHFPVPKCLACRQPTGELDWQVFITGYPAQNERKDYWGGLHLNCVLPEPFTDHYSPA